MFGELVEQHPLQLLARHPVIVALHALADFVAQFVEAFEPDRLGQRVVDRGRQTLANLLGRDLEHPLLAGHFRDRLGRERILISRLFAGATPSN